jgi:hypothetical protein
VPERHWQTHRLTPAQRVTFSFLHPHIEVLLRIRSGRIEATLISKMKTLVTSVRLKKSFLTKRDLLINAVVLLALIYVDAAPTQSAKSGFNFDNTRPARS